MLLKPLPVSLKKYQNMLILASIYDFFHINWPTVCAFMLFVKLKPCIQNVHIPLVILMTSHTSTSNWWRRVYNARMHFKFPLQNMDVVPTSKSIDNGKGAKVCHSFIHMYTYLEIGRIAGCMKIFAHGISRDFLFTFLFLTDDCA